jgi:hypothetical protein
MNSVFLTAKELLNALFSQLELDTSRWTYANTPELRAVVVPSTQPDGLHRMTVHIQPNKRTVPRDILGCAIQIAEAPQGIETRIEQSGRAVFSGLAAGCYHLEIAKERAGARVIAFRQASKGVAELQNKWSAFSQSTQWAALDLDKARRKIWEWHDEQGTMEGHAILGKDKSLTFRFWSSDLTLEGACLLLRIGALQREITFHRVSQTQVLGEIELLRHQRPPDITGIEFQEIRQKSEAPE